MGLLLDQDDLNGLNWAFQHVVILFMSEYRTDNVIAADKAIFTKTVSQVPDKCS